MTTTRPQRKKSILEDDLQPDYITLTRYVLNRQRKHPEATGELSQLLTNLQSAIKACSCAVRKAGFSDLFGLAGGSNITGDKQKKLDVIANELVINMLRSSFAVSLMISEEDDEPIFVEENQSGNYVVAFDPLDGSSNIDCLGTIGTIFSIWKRSSFDYEGTGKMVIPTGRSIVCAGFALYGSATVIVLALSGSVNCFMLYPGIGDFILTERKMKIPQKGNYYSINEGNTIHWNKAVAEYVHKKKFPKEGKPYTARYIGSMVADIFRTIKYGGIFMYPSNSNNLKGKIRLLYEAYPIAYIMEAVGGCASNGEQPILDIQAETIHDSCQVFMGSPEDVNELLEMYKKENKK